MGTRSLLAMEPGPNKYYIQYMQFDGHPDCKGKEYYEAILESLMENSSYFITKDKPNRKLFKRIKDFLNNYRYASGHSYNNDWIIEAKDWEKQDVWQEWQYLFDKDGNFTFFNVSSLKYYCTIPWEFTLNLGRSFGKYDILPDDNSKLASFWEYAKDWDGKREPPELSLETGECLAFPEQGDKQGKQGGGWRHYGILISRNKTLAKSSFADGKYRKRNKQRITIQFKSDYLTVKNCPQKDLPLLVDLKREDAKALLSKRLKGEPCSTTIPTAQS